MMTEHFIFGQTKPLKMKCVISEQLASSQVFEILAIGQ